MKVKKGDIVDIRIGVRGIPPGQYRLIEDYTERSKTMANDQDQDTLAEILAKPLAGTNGIFACHESVRIYEQDEKVALELTTIGGVVDMTPEQAVALGTLLIRKGLMIAQRQGKVIDVDL